MDEIRGNIDRYWEIMTNDQMMSLSVVDYIVPFDETAEILRAVSIDTKFVCLLIFRIENSVNL